MELKMKNANVMGVHQFLGDGDHKKAIIYGELLKKVGLDNLQWAWQKIGRRLLLREGGVGG